MAETHDINQIAAERKALGSVLIAHSCDPDDIKLLHHFKTDIYRPKTGYEVDYPVREVFLPRELGRKEPILRCGKDKDVCSECQDCVEEWLPLEIALAHNIRDTDIEPSPFAQNAKERIEDGRERGEWIYGKILGQPAEMVDVRTVEFDLQADEAEPVLKWLEEIPEEVERADSSVWS
jgi:hypothetical protein